MTVSRALEWLESMCYLRFGLRIGITSASIYVRDRGHTRVRRKKGETLETMIVRLALAAMKAASEPLREPRPKKPPSVRAALRKADTGRVVN